MYVCVVEFSIFLVFCIDSLSLSLSHSLILSLLLPLPLPLTLSAGISCPVDSYVSILRLCRAICALLVVFSSFTCEIMRVTLARVYMYVRAVEPMCFESIFLQHTSTIYNTEKLHIRLRLRCMSALVLLYSCFCFYCCCCYCFRVYSF